MVIDKGKRIFKRAESGSIKISDNALQVIFQFRQLLPDATEAGGVLLGRFILESEDIVVDDVTTPGEEDKRTRNRFVRNKRRHQLEVTRRWRESGGTCNYLGEWHTHPEPMPLPSPEDICDWRRTLREAQFDSETLFFVIVGTDDLLTWEGFKKTLEIRQLALEVREGERNGKT
ncbi:MAG: Mov34/MPN/PAD-1 family protein [Bacillota bacterium]